MADLTPKQRRFVEVYLSNGENGVEAYRAAYSKTASYKNADREARRLLSNPRLTPVLNEARRRAKQRTDRIVERYAINKEKVLLELARIGFADVTDVVNVVESGETKSVEIKATADLSEDVRRAISEISETTNESGDRTIKVKQHSKLTALQQIAKILGYDKPTPQDDGAVDDMAGDPDPERIDRGESSEGG